VIIFNRRLLAAVGLAAVLGCGDENAPAPRVADDGGPQLLADPAPTVTTTAGSNVKACDLPGTSAAALGFNLADTSYSNDIFPIVQAKCVRCHGGDQTDKQNSTTCGYMEKNIDNIIARLNNMAPADALKDQEAAKATDDPTKLTDDQIRNQIAGNDRSLWPMPPVNRNRQQNPGITPDEIAVFVAWKDVGNKCVGADLPPDDALPVITAHTDDEEQRTELQKSFATAACEDGPAVAPDWSVVQSLVALPDGASSSFYDYQKQQFVAGATAMPGDCTIDVLMQLVKSIAGAEQVLTEYKNYGWRAIQCSIVDGRPRAYLAHVARVPNALGDKVYGVYLKDFHIEQRP
jgi:hypothetical protein